MTLNLRYYDPFNEEMVYNSEFPALSNFFISYEKRVAAGNEPILMVSTGLKDKNGKEIWEGDRISFSVFDYNDHDTQYEGVIVYSGSRFMIWKSAEDEFYGSDGGFDLDWVLGQDDELEVIGNVWEGEK